MTTTAYHRAKTGRKKVDIDERRREVEDLMKALAEWEAEQDPSYIALVLAKFDGYSPVNAKLIAMRDPHATDVDSIKAWKLRGTETGGAGRAVMTGKGKDSWKQYVIPVIRPAGMRMLPDPKNEGKFIEVPTYYYVWHGLYDFRFTVENTPEAIGRWHSDHPSGEWDEQVLQECRHSRDPLRCTA